MTLSDFAQLEVGDTISLDQKISEPLKMYIENQQFGIVKPGKKEDKFAVELLEFSEGNLNDE
jgi:flagellar motor switch protein FliM